MTFRKILEVALAFLGALLAAVKVLETTEAGDELPGYDSDI